MYNWGGCSPLPKRGHEERRRGKKKGKGTEWGGFLFQALVEKESGKRGEKKTVWFAAAILRQ